MIDVYVLLHAPVWGVLVSSPCSDCTVVKIVRTLQTAIIPIAALSPIRTPWLEVRAVPIQHGAPAGATLISLGRDQQLMSYSDTPMPAQASPTLSRRLFARRSFTALAGAASIALAGTTAAQELTDESVEVMPRPEQESAEVAEPQYSTGDYITGFALQFVGYPYVWAGNTPAGFDCSGFTQYVILNTLGIDIGHGTAGQVNYGYYVDGASLMPGDLVYFANTFGPGISHAGIYIGGGQFVHAENEGTGVTIGWVWSDYYAAHFWGGIRLW